MNEKDVREQLYQLDQDQPGLYTADEVVGALDDFIVEDNERLVFNWDARVYDYNRHGIVAFTIPNQLSEEVEAMRNLVQLGKKLRVVVYVED